MRAEHTLSEFLDLLTWIEVGAWLCYDWSK